MAGSYVTQRLEVKVDRSKKLVDALNQLVGKDVLVGVPATVAAREGEPINNAMLAYINEFGSPAANIPARPFLMPGIRDARTQIERQLRSAVDAALTGEGTRAEGFMNRAGIVAVNAIKQRIRANIPPPLKPGTVRGRKYSRGTKGRRKGEDEYAELISQGASPAAAQNAAGIVALINTGQMLRAITWVLRKSGVTGRAKAPPLPTTQESKDPVSGAIAAATLRAAERETRGAF